MMNPIEVIPMMIAPILIHVCSIHADSEVKSLWGNALYVDISVGDSFSYLEKEVTLLDIKGNYCTIDVNGQSKQLIVARRALPEVINGLCVFVADNQNVKQLTNDNQNHGLLTRDALLCLSDPDKPLLNPDLYTFPISQRDGYQWSMEEGSHIYAYLGWVKNRRIYRSHEGVDLNMHEARGKEIHPIVAVEDGSVVMAVDHEVTRSENEGCIIIQSKSQPYIHYVYKHIYDKTIAVKENQKVKKGDFLGYIWGDWKWGHLHFAVVKWDTQYGYSERYSNLVNCFPQLYELWHGNLEPRPVTRDEGEFRFDQRYWIDGYRSPAYVYDNVIQYGWLLGDWCAAGRIEGNNETNGRLRKTLHQGTPAEVVNPLDYYDFQIDVKPGRYSLRLKLGDEEYATWQRVRAGDMEIGTYSLAKNEFLWTPDTIVPAQDEKLIIRFYIKGDNSEYGAVKRIQFRRY